MSNGYSIAWSDGTFENYISTNDTTNNNSTFSNSTFVSKSAMTDFSNSRGFLTQNNTWDDGYNQVEYIDKAGAKFEKYDHYEGTYKIYKEEAQDYYNAAKMDSPNEPLCKGRNQIIIVADNRLPAWFND
jgi:hypothetical protein